MKGSSLRKLLVFLPTIVLLSSCSLFQSDKDKLKEAIKDYQASLPYSTGEGMYLIRVDFSEGANVIVFESEAEGLYSLSSREKDAIRKGVRDMLKFSFVGETGSEMYKVFDNVRPDFRFLVRNADSGRILFDETFLPNEYL
ncbi:MAG: hypothetical protein IKW89_13440 [Bacteroidales bacterium]|nr:hypothetical protein [Bacteroidales bacterium]